MVDGIAPDIDEQADMTELLQTREQSRLSPLFSVLMHDDPVTSMDFVVSVLMNLFGYNHISAFEVMYLIHSTGIQKVASLPLERAEMSVVQVRQMALQNGYPLTCTLEQE